MAKISQAVRAEICNLYKKAYPEEKGDAWTHACVVTKEVEELEETARRQEMTINGKNEDLSRMWEALSLKDAEIRKLEKAIVQFALLLS